MERSRSLAGLIEKHTRVDGAHPTAVRGLTLYRFSAPSPPGDTLYEPSLCVIAQGSKRLMVGRREYRYDAERYLLVSADVPAMARVVTASTAKPFLGLQLFLDPLEVGELISQLGLHAQQPSSLGLVVSEPDAAVVDAVVRLVATLESPRDAAVLGAMLRREVTYRLLVGPLGPRLRQLVSGTDQGQRVTRALRWLKAHYTEPLRVETLARHAAMSPSALHKHFKEVTALSPLQYQKRLRLHEARRLMLGESLGAAEASFRVGYESPSQFNREYRRLFGTPPHRDVEALRQDEQGSDRVGGNQRLAVSSSAP